MRERTRDAARAAAHPRLSGRPRRDARPRPTGSSCRSRARSRSSAASWRSTSRRRRSRMPRSTICFACWTDLQGTGRDADLRVASAAGGVRAVRPDHGPARRAATSGRSTARRRGPDADRPRDGRPRSSAARRGRRARVRAPSDQPLLESTGLTRRPCVRARLARGAPGRDRLSVRAGRLGAVRAARDAVRPLHAGRRQRSRIDGRAFASPRRATRRAPAWHSCPRIASSQGLLLQPRSAPQPRAAARSRARGSLVAARSTSSARRRRAMLRAWSIKASGARGVPRQSQRRQPAEGRARALAGDRRRACCCMDEPTKGVDVGAKFEIHGIIRRQARGRDGLPGRLERSAGGAGARASRRRHA